MSDAQTPLVETPAADIESLLAQAAGGPDIAEPAIAGPAKEVATPAASNEPPHPQFPVLSSLSEADFRKLRARHEEYINLLAGRLSMHLGLEVTLQMAKLETLTFQKFADSLSNPTHLTLLKLEPLAGTCLLDIPSLLGLCMVDRELGGPALAAEEPRELGKMEAKLLSKIVETIVAQWCGAWTDVIELRPALLKHENNARFLKVCPADTMMFVIGMETKIGELVEVMQFAIPLKTLEPLLQKLNAADDPVPKAAPAPVPSGTVKWNSAFDEVELEITAEMPDVEVTARQLAELKPGDLISLPPQIAEQVRLCFSGAPKFSGTLGTAEGNWAVKIEKTVKAAA